MSLTKWTVAALEALRHPNGAPVIRVFGKHHSHTPSSSSSSSPSSTSAAAGGPQGSIVNFVVLDERGRVRSYKDFERRAAVAGLHVR
jgi:molybdenum cofactor sulfurtransferase